MENHDQSWLRSEADKLIHLIDTCSDTELDKLLEDSNFGSLSNCMSPLVEKTLADPHFSPRKKVGELKGKAVYEPVFPNHAFYERNGKVYCDFVSSEGKKMRYWYQYKLYDTSDYCKKHNIPLNEQPTEQPFEMLVMGAEFIN